MVYVISKEKLPEANKQKRNVVEKEKNMHNTMKVFMHFSQVLGVLPQENVGNMKNMKFQWKSFRTAYTLCMIVAFIFALGCSYLAWMIKRCTFDGIGKAGSRKNIDHDPNTSHKQDQKNNKDGYISLGISIRHRNSFQSYQQLTHVTYFGSLATLVLHLRLAKYWSELMVAWCKMDDTMNKNYGYLESLDKRMKICMTVAILCGSVDWTLALVSRYDSLFFELQDKYSYDEYYKHLFPEMFEILPVNYFTGTFCSILTAHSYLTFPYNDAFIIMLSSSLALRYQQITKKLERNYRKIKPESFWVEIREDYNRLTVLCRHLDDRISYIVLLTFSTNVFFILVQVYGTLKSPKRVASRIYFILSYFYLVVKIIYVSLYAAWINDESKEPSCVLNSVPSASYNTEIRRLLGQIEFDGAVLTGCRMFRVTRGILLSIAGAVVTYELILIQFDNVTKDD